jgi:hypothetical protein
MMTIYAAYRFHRCRLQYVGFGLAETMEMELNLNLKVTEQEEEQAEQARE